MTDDPMEIGILQVQQLVKPVNKLDVRVAPQLGENGGGFDRLIRDRVQFAEKGCALDVGHGGFLFSLLGVRFQAALSSKFMT